MGLCFFNGNVYIFLFWSLENYIMIYSYTLGREVLRRSDYIHLSSHHRRRRSGGPFSSLNEHLCGVARSERKKGTLKNEREKGTNITINQMEHISRERPTVCLLHPLCDKLTKVLRESTREDPPSQDQNNRSSGCLEVLFAMLHLTLHRTADFSYQSAHG